MRSSLEQVLDTCIAQLNSGQDLEAVLAAFPQDADELRPMLVAVALMRIKVPPPTQKMVRKSAFLASVEQRRREVELTEGYVVELKAGVPVPELLERATPGVRPLIRAAWRLFTTPAPAPAPEKVAAGKARLMALAASRRAARTVPERGLAARLSGTWTGVRRGLAPASSVRRRAWSGALALVVVMTVLGTSAAGVGKVAASSLPGDSLYEVKEIGRTAQLMFAFDPARRAELNVRFSEQRLDEMTVLARFGREVPIEAVEAWLGSQAKALASIERLPYDQRRLLTDMLLASGDRATTDARLRDAVADPAALDRLLSQSDEILARAGSSADGHEGTVEPSRNADDIADFAPVDDGRRAPGRTLPDDRAAQRSGPQPEPEPRQAPPQVVVPVNPLSAPPAPVPQAQYVQAGGEEQQESRSASASHEAPAPAGTQPTTAAPTEETTTSPPAYNQPIFEEPTDTPEPPAPAPQGSGGEEPTVLPPTATPEPVP